MAVFNVRDLLIDRLGVPVTTRKDTTTIGVTVPGTEFLKGNPARVGFVAINASGSTMFVYPLRVPIIGVGLRLEANGGALFVNWEEDGEMVAWPWFGLTTVSGRLDTLEALIDAKAPRSPREEG